MRKFFVQIVALMLVFCLITQPVMAYDGTGDIDTPYPSGDIEKTGGTQNVEWGAHSWCFPPGSGQYVQFRLDTEIYQWYPVNHAGTIRTATTYSSVINYQNNPLGVACNSPSSQTINISTLETGGSYTVSCKLYTKDIPNGTWTEIDSNAIGFNVVDVF